MWVPSASTPTARVKVATPSVNALVPSTVVPFRNVTVPVGVLPPTVTCRVTVCVIGAQNLLLLAVVVLAIVFSVFILIGFPDR